MEQAARAKMTIQPERHLKTFTTPDTIARILAFPADSTRLDASPDTTCAIRFMRTNRFNASFPTLRIFWSIYECLSC